MSIPTFRPRPDSKDFYFVQDEVFLLHPDLFASLAAKQAWFRRLNGETYADHAARRVFAAGYEALPDGWFAGSNENDADSVVKALTDRGFRVTDNPSRARFRMVRVEIQKNNKL